MRSMQLVVGLIMGVVLIGASPASEGAGAVLKSASNLPPLVSLRPNFEMWNLTPRNQGERGSCSMFASRALIEYELARVLGENTLLSVEYLNWAANGGIGLRRNGGYFRDAQKGFETHGICPESMLPYADKYDPNFTPSAEMKKAAERYREMDFRFHWIHPHTRKPGLSDAEFAAVKRTIASGHPVAAGAGHSRVLIGYREDSAQPGGGVFFTLDSLIESKRWADQCTEDGYGEVTYDYVKNKLHDAFWLELAGEKKVARP